MKSAKTFKGMGSYGTIGIEIVLSILVGLFVGMWLDDRFGTKPWMSVLWFGFGCGAAGRSVYRSWKSMQVAARREEAEEGNPAQAFPDDKTMAWQREEKRERAEREEREAREARLARGEAEMPLDDGAESATNESGEAEKRNGND